MIPFLFLDLLLGSATQYIPCFFLVGFYLQKKITILEILSIFIVYDIGIYKTYGFFAMILLILNQIKIQERKKNILHFNFFIFLFIFFLLLKNRLSITLLWNPKIIMTFFLLNLIYLTIPKKGYLTHSSIKKKKVKSKYGIMTYKKVK